MRTNKLYKQKQKSEGEFMNIHVMIQIELSFHMDEDIILRK